MFSKISVAAVALSLFLLSSSCGSGNDAKSETKVPDSLKSTDTTAHSATRTGAAAKFQVQQQENKETGNPSSVISLSLNGNDYPLTTITGNADLIPASQFSEKGIPADAIDACGAWWAGAGDYFYVVVSGKEYIVFQGWQDEQQEDEGYHWKEMKRIAAE